MSRTALLLLAVAAAPSALAQTFKVDPEAGNSTFSATFESDLGERITATSSALDCQVRYDRATGMKTNTLKGLVVASAVCSLLASGAALAGDKKADGKAKDMAKIVKCGGVNELRATVKLAGRLEIAPPPPEVREALLKAFRERKKP